MERHHGYSLRPGPLALLALLLGAFAGTRPLANAPATASASPLPSEAALREAHGLARAAFADG
jgi:hypothetical protein